MKKLVSSCHFFPFLQLVSWHQLKETACHGEFRFCVSFLHYSLVVCVSLSFMHLTHKTTITDHARHQRQLITLLMACLARSAVEVYVHHYILKHPYHDSPYCSEIWLRDLMKGHPDRFHGQFGVHKHVFRHLVTELQALGMANSKHLTLDEHVAIFLYSVVSGLLVQLISECFQHSFSMISMLVLAIIIVWWFHD